MSAAGSLSPDPPARDVIADLYGTALVCSGPILDPPQFADSVLAALGVPVDVPTSTITRALARDALIQAHFDAPFPRGLDGPEYIDYEDDRELALFRALRAVGSPVPGDPKATT